MRINPLSGKAGYWLRQYSDTSERDAGRLAETITKLGGGDLLVEKCMDGLTWQGRIDPLTPITSLAGVQALAQQYTAAGVTFCPVVVPRGADIAGEAAAHAALAKAAGVLMVDLECYTGFWDGSAYDQIPVYTAALRLAAPDAYLCCQPDPREWAWTPTHIEQIAPDFDGFCPQHYVGWTAGGVNWTDVTLEVQRFARFAALGRDMYVTLYGVDDIQLAGQFWQAVQARALGYHVFALGAMDAAELQYFAGLPRPRQPVPEPAPQPQPSMDHDWMLRNGLSAQAIMMLAALNDSSKSVQEAVQVAQARCQQILATIAQT